MLAVNLLTMCKPINDFVNHSPQDFYVLLHIYQEMFVPNPTSIFVVKSKHVLLEKKKKI